MSPTRSILANEFSICYDENESHLLIRTINDGKLSPPIRISLETMRKMGSEQAAKWLGETLLLLVPRLRTEIYGLPEEGT